LDKDSSGFLYLWVAREHLKNSPEVVESFKLLANTGAVDF
jgi:hypothetical protein